MDCDAVRAAYLESLVERAATGTEAVVRHIETCPGCRDEIRALGAVWEALGALPLAEPSAEARRGLIRRLRWAAAVEPLRSIESWQQAALAGVVGFLVSVLFSLLVPYEAMVAACESVAAALPTGVAYLMGGFLYGLAPMAIAVAVQARRQVTSGIVAALEAPFVFLVALVPYVVIRCAEFPPALLAGFVAGLATGAVLGGGAGAWLGRRHAFS